MARSVKEVDYVIIGAGMAGTVLARFLRSGRTVLLDPNPGDYKIGESIIPEHFHHPALRETVSEVKKLPSYSPKTGSIFVSKDTVASFPLPPHDADVAMHVARDELEGLMHRLWHTEILRERVRSIDLSRRAVCTERHEFRVQKQIIDCSGPAMVLARHLGAVEPLWPVFATWTYFDISDIDDEKFWNWTSQAGIDYRRYDVPHGRLLPASEDRLWRPSKTTILTQLESGLWTWQIPLFSESLLSFGAVSRNGPLDDHQLFELAETACAPHYTLRRRPVDKSSPYNRVHTRNNFARKARTAASDSYILLADACAFADPIYSVGTGLAVNKAIELAAVLNEEGWSQSACDRYNTDYAELLARAVQAFEAWYHGDLLSTDEAAREVQENFLIGRAFQVGIATHYSRVIADAGPPLDQPRPGGGGRNVVDAKAAPITDAVAALLGLGADRALRDWRLAGAYPTPRGVQQRWTRDGQPELVINAAFSPDVTRYYRRIADISLSFMNLWDRPYPLEVTSIQLFDALEAKIRKRRSDWMRLATELGLPTA